MARPINIKSLIRKHLSDIEIYDSVESPETLALKAGIPKDHIIKLNGNENPYGGSPKALTAVANSDFHIYPDPEQKEMKKALAAYTGADPDEIVVGAGADVLIDLVFRLFLSPGEKILDCEPTFGMYSFCARIAGGSVSYVPRDAMFEIDVAAVKRAIDSSTKIIFVTSPNNPTGNLASVEQIVEILKTGLLVVVDEAYYEFSGQTVQHLVKEHQNLILLRTMSKWAGLAGLRVGYGITNPIIANHLMDIKPPYNVNVAAESALIASLEDADYLLSNVEKIKSERERLYAILKNIPGICPWPSQGNYILCEFADNQAVRIYNELASRGIFVRNFKSDRLKNCFRIAIGKPEESDAFIKVVSKIL